MSNPSVSQVRRWAANGHALGDVASAVDSKVDEFDNAMNAMTRDVDHVMLEWKGEVARASETTTLSEKQISNRLGMGILQVTDILNSLAPDFVHASTTAINEIDHIQQMGYTIADNGCVSPPATPTAGYPTDVPTGVTTEEAATIAATNATNHQTTVQSALHAVGAADAAIASKITDAANALDAAADRATTAHAVSPEVQSILDGKAKLPDDPTMLHSFWNSLSANDKAALWNHDRNIGNKDGIPAADRDHFNRRHLVEMQRDTERELKALGPVPKEAPKNDVGYLGGRPSKSENEEYSRWRKQKPLIDRLEQLSKLDEKLNEPGKPPRFLLTNRDDGRAAVAVNNPDTARNVATYVPGTGTNLGTMGGDINRSDKMVHAAIQADSSSTTSVITWSDYKAPQEIFPDAARIGYARHAADGLDNFQNGLFATHIGDSPAHSTVLGHSYGTTVVSSAATDGHILNTNQVIMVASPGMDHGASNPADFNLTGVPSDEMKHRFWSTTSSSDAINLVPEAVLGPKPDGGGDFHGDQTFKNDPHGGHSDYWNNRNPALKNIGAIIAGQYQKVTR